MKSLEPITNPNMKSDLTTALALARAAITGALANVEINLASLKDQAFAAEVRKRVQPSRRDVACNVFLTASRGGCRRRRSKLGLDHGWTRRSMGSVLLCDPRRLQVKYNKAIY